MKGDNMTIYFDKFGWFLGELPEDCVADCTTPGQDASISVAYWQNRLGFKVPRDLAIRYLKEFGAWDSLETESDTTLADRCL